MGSFWPAGFPAASTGPLEQGSNISSGCPGPRRPGTTHNKIDQGRSLTLRAPQGCLRVWVRQPRTVLREQADPAPTTWILPGLPEYTQASEFTSSRLPTYSLVKELGY